LIYGANPTILFEALSNVHNDIFIVLFILLAIYFVTKKKNLMLSVAFIAMATAITVIVASQLGLPVSSTHIAIGGVFGVGFGRT
jgi:uncharacterized membrane protein